MSPRNDTCLPRAQPCAAALSPVHATATLVQPSDPSCRLPALPAAVSEPLDEALTEANDSWRGVSFGDINLAPWTPRLPRLGTSLGRWLSPVDGAQRPWGISLAVPLAASSGIVDVTSLRPADGADPGAVRLRQAYAWQLSFGVNRLMALLGLAPLLALVPPLAAVAGPLLFAVNGGIGCLRRGESAAWQTLTAQQAAAAVQAPQAVWQQLGVLVGLAYFATQPQAVRLPFVQPWAMLQAVGDGFAQEHSSNQGGNVSLVTGFVWRAGREYARQHSHRLVLHSAEAEQLRLQLWVHNDERYSNNRVEGLLWGTAHDGDGLRHCELFEGRVAWHHAAGRLRYWALVAAHMAGDLPPAHAWQSHLYQRAWAHSHGFGWRWPWALPYFKSFGAGQAQQLSCTMTSAASGGALAGVPSTLAISGMQESWRGGRVLWELQLFAEQGVLVRGTFKTQLTWASPARVALWHSFLHAALGRENTETAAATPATDNAPDKNGGVAWQQNLYAQAHFAIDATQLRRNAASSVALATLLQGPLARLFTPEQASLTLQALRDQAAQPTHRHADSDALLRAGAPLLALVLDVCGTKRASLQWYCSSVQQENLLLQANAQALPNGQKSVKATASLQEALQQQLSFWRLGSTWPVALDNARRLQVARLQRACTALAATVGRPAP